MTAELSRRRSWAVWIAGAVLLPVLYVLSLGPAVWLAQRWSLPDALAEGLSLFYRPAVEMIDWAGERSETAVRFFEWYFGLFIG